MIRFAALLSLALCARPALAADPLKILRQEGYASVVTQARSLPDNPKDPGWEKAAPIVLTAYPQRSISPGLTEPEASPINIELRVLAKGKTIAARLTWPDAIANTWQTDHTDAFADAAALQFALPGKAGTLPYIGMGQHDHPVDLWFWRNGRETERLSARGFGTLEQQPGKKPESVSLWENGAWQVVLSGTIPDKTKSLLTVAVALWDGRSDGRDGRKRLTAWHILSFPGIKANSRALSALAKEAAAHGNPERGKSLAAEHGCSGCHRLPGGDPVDIGPDLTLAGGLHWPGYLRRSLTKPSSFLVPVDRFAEEGILASGKSLMPRMELSDQDVEDLVAYMRLMN